MHLIALSLLIVQNFHHSHGTTTLAPEPEYTDIQLAIGILKIYDQGASSLSTFVTGMLTSGHGTEVVRVLDAARKRNPFSKDAPTPTTDQIKRLFDLIVPNAIAPFFGLNSTMPFDLNDLRNVTKNALIGMDLTNIASPSHATLMEDYGYTLVWFARNCANGALRDRLCSTTNNFIAATYKGEDLSKYQYEIFRECTKELVKMCCPRGIA